MRAKVLDGTCHNMVWALSHSPLDFTYSNASTPLTVNHELNTSPKERGHTSTLETGWERSGQDCGGKSRMTDDHDFGSLDPSERPGLALDKLYSFLTPVVRGHTVTSSGSGSLLMPTNFLRPPYRGCLTVLVLRQPTKCHPLFAPQEPQLFQLCLFLFTVSCCTRLVRKAPT